MKKSTGRLTSTSASVGGIGTYTGISGTNAAADIDSDTNDDGYAGDVDDSNMTQTQARTGAQANDRGSRSRVICRRCESRPFLIYQDPEWVDVQGVDVDPFVHAAASDDKENVDPNGGGGGGGENVNREDDGRRGGDGDGDVEMGG